MSHMILCEHCKRVLGSVQESAELEVRGEVTLKLLCGGCKEVHYEELYVYNQKRIKKKK
jgi:phage FluMu protein Com